MAQRLAEPFAYYDSYQDGMVEVEAGFPIVDGFDPADDVVPGELPGGRTVTAVHLGMYETAGSDVCRDARLGPRLAGLKPVDSMWEEYLIKPQREPDHTRWRAGVFLRVE